MRGTISVERHEEERETKLVKTGMMENAWEQAMAAKMKRQNDRKKEERAKMHIEKGSLKDERSR